MSTVLKRKRGLVRGEVTRIDNAIGGIGDLPVDQCKAYILRLQAIQPDLTAWDEKVLDALLQEQSTPSSKITDDEVESDYETASEYQNTICICIVKLEAHIAESQGSVPTNALGAAQSNNLSNQAISSHAAPKAKNRLPQVPLPVFSNKEGEDLHKFLLNFEALLTKCGYKTTDFEMFMYLKGQLGGSPLSLINTLETAAQTYETAKDLLNQSFASKIVQQYQAIRRLSELKFSLKDPYEYVGKLRQIKESMDNLSIDKDIILQYYFWNSMPELLQNQFVQITNNYRPTLKELDDNIFNAMDRFLDISSKSPKKCTANTTATAVNVEHFKGKNYKPNQYCSLCSQPNRKVTSHSTYACRTYPAPTDKIKRLKDLGACEHCANMHNSADCNFAFKQACKHCSGKHYSFLCRKAPEPKRDDGAKAFETNKRNSGKGFKSGNKKPDTNQASVHASCTWINSVEMDYTGDDAILPTFACSINGRTIRGMRDSGAQACFVRKNVADELNFKVLNPKFTLNVHGFNTSRSIITKVVEVPLFEGRYAVPAICVPDIRTSIHLPGLSRIAKSFQGKGYILADPLLSNVSDKIDNIEFILGDNEAQVIPQSDVQFGSEPSSMYANTPRGVMLLGSIKRMLSNLPYLPSNGHSGGMGYAPDIVSGGVHTLAAISDIGLSQPEVFIDVIDEHDKIDQRKLNLALNAAIKSQVDTTMAYDSSLHNDEIACMDQEVIDHILSEATRDPDTGRLSLPMVWASGHSHRLANNFNLSKAILTSNYAKLSKTPDKLKMYDEVIKEQQNMGVIEEIGDITSYMQTHPMCSFLPHMGVYRMTNETTKCRVVYLSNLADRRIQKDAISHNQAMMSGPCLTKKIATAVCDLRWGKYMFTYDVIKAFLNIGLLEKDMEKLLFLWYRDVAKKDLSLVAYRCTRVAFGLRPSPFLLAIALHKILIEDASNDVSELRDLKTQLYSNMYVDNGAYTCDSIEQLHTAFSKLNAIFNPYQFYLQQFVSNDPDLQASIDATIDGKDTPEVNKLLGLQWDRTTDTLSTRPLYLAPEANTKRTIMSSLASNFDIFQFNGPILNRAKLFMHGLQINNELGWDTKLHPEQQHEYQLICKQVNKSAPMKVPRCMGKRDGEYNLIACVDASKALYGVVLYLEDRNTGSKSFLAAKNRVVNKQLENKTIPCLEFNAISMGVEMLHEYYEELSGSKTQLPVNITKLKLYSDSMVSLHWLQGACIKLDKMQKLTPFVRNRLMQITKLCNLKPIEFRFITSGGNPADLVTRIVSHNQLMKSNYLIGPEADSEAVGAMYFTVPAEFHHSEVLLTSTDLSCEHSESEIPDVGEANESFINFNSFSDFEKLFNRYRAVFRCLAVWKQRVQKTKGNISDVQAESQLNQKTWDFLIKKDQMIHFAEVVNYFATPDKTKSSAPPVVTQLNVFCDKDGILRVRAKFDRWFEKRSPDPCLLAKNSALTRLIIRQVHIKKGHAGCYSVLNELRRRFYIQSHFSTVKKAISHCTICKRQNGRTINVNQNAYRDFRLAPPDIPYRYVFIDHFGPYVTTNNGHKSKVYVLLLTCLWSRAINLKLCIDMSVNQFLRGLQTHIFEFGTPELILSDQGSTLIAGGNVVSSMINNMETKKFLCDNGIKDLTISQYPTGNHSLGSLVESAVKIAKRMINGLVGKQNLDIFDFQFLLDQTVCLVNKRPIAFKEALRDNSVEKVLPAPISPESLLRGHDLATLNILPSREVDIDPDWLPEKDSKSRVINSFEKLNKNREKLAEIYQEEFLAELTHLATNRKDRYAQLKHEKLNVGDICLIKEPMQKAVNFQMGIVEKIFKNSLEEVTEVVLRKANRERIRRHVNSVILLLKSEEKEEKLGSNPTAGETSGQGSKITTGAKPKRKAAAKSRQHWKRLRDDDMI